MNDRIHRLLDEAFSGIVMTSEAQDLKEEIRANLIARVDELEAAGVPPEQSAGRAVAELGEIRELLGDTVRSPAAPWAEQQAILLRNRVRPKPAFVARAVLWSTVLAVGLLMTALGASGLLAMAPGAVALMIALAAAGLGLLVGDSLAQETSGSHPMPLRRAGGYGLAAALLLGALGLGGVDLGALLLDGSSGLGALPIWCAVLAVVAFVVAAALFAVLGTTQTNRRKAWTRQAAEWMPANRFEREPETAARFGVYTVVIWLIAVVVAVVLAVAADWWWAPLALLGGLAAMMLLLARMMFGPPHGG